MDGASAADAALATLRGDVINIVLGTVFLTVGATACTIAAIRGRRGVRILVWWGIFSGMYGLQELGQTPTLLTVLPHSLNSIVPYVNTAVMYLLLISALFAWRELTLGRLRLVIQLEILVGLAIALVGMGTFALGGPANQWMFYNNLLAVLNTLVLLPFVLVPRFCRFLVIPNSRVPGPGALIFCVGGAQVTQCRLAHSPRRRQISNSATSIFICSKASKHSRISALLILGRLLG
ncbi:MAG TPA: hypothetical protein VNX87_04085 [Candidatus Sulfotelmatobacter sp.]|nr:hypothetical protein [Candidatus Sulfotelmatobacter sp.]